MYSLVLCSFIVLICYNYLVINAMGGNEYKDLPSILKCLNSDVADKNIIFYCYTGDIIENHFNGYFMTNIRTKPFTPTTSESSYEHHDALSEGLKKKTDIQLELIHFGLPDNKETPTILPLLNNHTAARLGQTISLKSVGSNSYACQQHEVYLVKKPLQQQRLPSSTEEGICADGNQPLKPELSLESNDHNTKFNQDKYLSRRDQGEFKLIACLDFLRTTPVVCFFCIAILLFIARIVDPSHL